MPTVGVLALQGAFAKHAAVLQSLCVKVQLVRSSEELQRCDALIIPGGESTTMLKHIDRMGLKEPLCSFAEKKPVLGTCAGLILLAQEVNDLTVLPLKILDIHVVRNGYGRQVESFSAAISLALPSSKKPFHALFIRAPRIKACGADVEVLATWNSEPVFVQQNRILATTFHPELTDDPCIHRHFLSLLGHDSKDSNSEAAISGNSSVAPR